MVEYALDTVEGALVCAVTRLTADICSRTPSGRRTDFGVVEPVARGTFPFLSGFCTACFCPATVRVFIELVFVTGVSASFRRRLVCP